MLKTVNDNNWYEDEVIETVPTEYIEENIYVDESFIKNKELIRLDLNVVQSPLFSKNTKRKINQVITYFFNKNRDMEWKQKFNNLHLWEVEKNIFVNT